jgi:hypothetical protein
MGSLQATAVAGIWRQLRDNGFGGAQPAKAFSRRPIMMISKNTIRVKGQREFNQFPRFVRWRLCVAVPIIDFTPDALSVRLDTGSVVIYAPAGRPSVTKSV